MIYINLNYNYNGNIFADLSPKLTNRVILLKKTRMDCCRLLHHCFESLIFFFFCYIAVIYPPLSAFKCVFFLFKTKHFKRCIVSHVPTYIDTYIISPSDKIYSLVLYRLLLKIKKSINL